MVFYCCVCQSFCMSLPLSGQGRSRYLGPQKAWSMAEHKDEGILDVSLLLHSYYNHVQDAWCYIFQKILSLVAPPASVATQKGRGGSKKARHGSSTTASVPAASNSAPSSSVRHVGMQNHPYCDACGDGGSLLCCDNCPASFHFNCW